MTVNNNISFQELQKPSFNTSIPTYQFTIDKHWKLKDATSVLCFPLGFYKLFHILAGYAIILSALSPKIKKKLAPLFKKEEEKEAQHPKPVEPTLDEIRGQIKDDQAWSYRRITVEVDGNKIDAMIAFNKMKQTDRWVLASNGNDECYEDGFTDSTCRKFQRIASKLEGNIISFNYPGAGASTGLPTKPALAKAYRAILQLLENQGAKEIVGYGYSIGGAVQGEALKKHKFKEGVKYVFIKDRTFSSLAKVVDKFGWLIKGLRWNLSSVESSQKLTKPEIILQTATQKKITNVNHLNKEGDGVISTEASLAKALLSDSDQKLASSKTFIGLIIEKHCTNFFDATLKDLAEKVNSLLKNQ